MLILVITSFDNFDPETINHVSLMAWYNRYKQHKVYKKI